MSEQVSNGSATSSTTATDLESYQKFALEQQAANNAWSAEQAQKQMDFQKEMSNTSHQREVADLKAAGLNPILSANSGASVGNGAMAESDKSAGGNVGQILQQVLQAQSAREVAGMYNAATIAAASIAANASMYGSDMSYWNTEDHPNSLEAYVARQLQNPSGSGTHAPGSGSPVGSGSNASGSGVAVGAGNVAASAGKVVSNLVNAVAGKNLNQLNGSGKFGSASPLAYYNWSSQFLNNLKKAGYNTSWMDSTYFKRWYSIWRQSGDQAAAKAFLQDYRKWQVRQQLNSASRVKYTSSRTSRKVTLK